MSSALHFESQRGMLCGLHAVNALLQFEYGDHYRKKDLDAICIMLDPPRCCHFNAHRHWMDAGDYDVNVLLYALSSRGLDGTWFDARYSVSKMELTGIVGLLVNGPSQGISGLSIGSGNHWYAIRLVNGQWWDLNSFHRAPRRFIDNGEMLNDVQHVLDAGGATIVIKPLGAQGGVAKISSIDQSKGAEKSAASEAVQGKNNGSVSVDTSSLTARVNTSLTAKRNTSPKKATSKNLTGPASIGLPKYGASNLTGPSRAVSSLSAASAAGVGASASGTRLSPVTPRASAQGSATPVRANEASRTESRASHGALPLPPPPSLPPPTGPGRPAVGATGFLPPPTIFPPPPRESGILVSRFGQVPGQPQIGQTTFRLAPGVPPLPGPPIPLPPPPSRRM